MFKKSKVSKKIIAIMTMLVLIVGTLPFSIFAYEKSYEAYDNAPYIQTMFDFRIREEGTNDIGTIAYCFNASKEAPFAPNDFVKGYKRLVDVSNETFVEYADNELDEKTLKQDVLNVIWNGYPYYGGKWKKADSEIKDKFSDAIYDSLIMRYGWAGGIPSKELNGWKSLTNDLCDIFSTQRAIWYYTDKVSPNSSYMPERTIELINEGENNPAPPNLELDLYDGKNAGKHFWLNYDFQNLLAVREDMKPPIRSVEIKINKKWQYSDGTLYDGIEPKASVFEIYEGNYPDGIPKGTTPIKEIVIPIGEKTATFTMLDDNKIYTIIEKTDNDNNAIIFDKSKKIIDFSKNNESMIEFTFVNEYNPPGKIIISKKVTGDNAPSNIPFYFEVEYIDLNNVNKKETFVLFEGESKEILTKNDTEYSVYERNVEDFVIDKILINNGQEMINDKVEGKTNNKIPTNIEFTNRYTYKKEGGLTLYKTADIYDINQKFDFNIKLTNGDNTPYNGTYMLNGELHSVDNGNIVVSLSPNNGNIKIEGLPEGTKYSIAEIIDDNYEVTGIAINGLSIKENEATGVIMAKANDIIRFNNTKKIPEKYSLTIGKLVNDGNKNIEHKNFKFNIRLTENGKPYNGQYSLNGSNLTYNSEIGINITIDEGETAIIGELPEGIEYNVKEIDFDKTKYKPKEESMNGNLNENKMLIFENEYIEKVGLKLSKTISGNGKDMVWDRFVFKVTFFDEKPEDVILQGDSLIEKLNDYEYIVKVYPDESVKFIGVKAGYNYSIEEMGAENLNINTERVDIKAFDTDGKVLENIAISERKIASTNIIDKDINIIYDNVINEMNEIVIKKDVTGIGDKNKDWNFTIALSDKHFNGVYNGEPGIKGIKFVNGLAKVSLKHGEIAKFSGLPTGVKYIVTEEEANKDGYETVAYNNENTIISPNITSLVRFVNNKEPLGDISLTKKVIGDGGDKEKAWEFAIFLDKKITGQYGDMSFENGKATVYLSDGETKVAKGLPANVNYNVFETEANKNNYVTDFINKTGKVEKNKTTEVICENKYNTFGSINLTKKVTGDNLDKNMEFGFVVKLINPDGSLYNGTYLSDGKIKNTDGEIYVKLKADETIKLEEIPVGIKYDIFEKDINGFKLTDIIINGESMKNKNALNSKNARGEITTNKVQEIEFQNTKISEDISLTLEKIVKRSNNKTIDKSFQFKIILEQNGKPYKGIYTIDNSKEILYNENTGILVSLKAGDKIMISDIPKGIQYTVSEIISKEDKQMYYPEEEIIKGSLIESEWINYTNIESGYVPPKTETDDYRNIGTILLTLIISGSIILISILNRKKEYKD